MQFYIGRKKHHSIFMPLLTFDTKQNEIKFISICRLQRKGIFITLGLIEIICFHLIACDRYQNMTHNTIDFDI